jgi:hypothetical protein
MERQSLKDKENRPYAGVWIYPVILILTPIVFYFVFYYAVSAFNKYGQWRPADEARVFSAIVGVLLCLLTIITGGLNKSFNVVKARVGEFFADLYTGLPLKTAAEWYRHNIKVEGAAFWIMFAPMLLNLAYLIISFLTYYKGSPGGMLGKPGLPSLPR